MENEINKYVDEGLYKQAEKKILELLELNKQLNFKLDKYKKALENIKSMDYRGNRCSCYFLAKEILEME